MIENGSPCPFCGEKLYDPRSIDFTLHAKCYFCGDYIIPQDDADDITDKFKRESGLVVSAYIKEKNISQADKPTMINKDLFESILSQAPKTPIEKADRLLLNVAKMSKYFGDYVDIYVKNVFQDKSICLYTLGYCKNMDEFKFIVNYLKEVDLIRTVGDDLLLTAKGWQRIESIEKVTSESQQGFVAMWFDDSMKPVYDEAIAEGIADAGYKPHKVDLREHNDKIDDEIIAQIKRSRFIVADFTGHRGGVYYEAGFGKGLGLEVFWTCREDYLATLHFDIRQYNCISWKPDELAEFRKRIMNMIESVLGRGTYKR